MQATIYTITPFDAEIGTTIKFSWSGNQAFKNRCIMVDDETGYTVYDNTIETFRLEHPINIELASLVNGKTYSVYITVIDKDEIESDLQSLPTTVLCLKTPVFQFSNCSNGQIISSSSYTFNLEYSQENGELLNTWNISIYDKSHNLQVSSGMQYVTENPFYTFTGFTNKSEYWVRAVGQTVNGIPIDTGDILISVTYTIQNVFSLLEPTNIPDLGAIQLRSNIVSPNGSTTNAPIYISNEYIDLLNDTLVYNEGFVISGDFSIVVKGYNVVPNKPLLILSADDSNKLKIIVYYRVVKNSTGEYDGYFELCVISSGIISTYPSDRISDVSQKIVYYTLDGSYSLDGSIRLKGYQYIWNDEQLPIMFCVTRTHGFYDIQATIIEEV